MSSHRGNWKQLALLLLALFGLSGCGKIFKSGTPSDSGSLSRLRTDQANLMPGTFGGNPEKTADVALSFGAFRGESSSNEHYFVSSLVLCVSHARFHGYDPAGAVKYPSADIKVGQLVLSPDGTALESIGAPNGTYDSIELELTEQCASGQSVQLVNGFGSFSTREHVKMKFVGMFEVSGQSTSVTLDLQSIVRELRKVMANSQIKPAIEYKGGRLK